MFLSYSVWAEYFLLANKKKQLTWKHCTRNPTDAFCSKMMTCGLTTVQGSDEKVVTIEQVCAIYLLLYMRLPGKKKVLIKAGLWEANKTANKTTKVLRYRGRQSSHRWYQNTFLNTVNKFIFCPGIRFSLQLPQSYFDINRIIEKDHPFVENGLKTSLCFYDNILMKTQMQKYQILSDH